LKSVPGKSSETTAPGFEDLELRTHYWDDQQARSAFKDFIFSIHGLDFNSWESAGYWDNAYSPYSYFKNGVIVASVCIYLLDAIIDGASTQLVQISGVGTLDAYRRMGLSRKLTELGLEYANKHDLGIFLFADEAAIPYYKSCGFTPLTEYIEIMESDPTDTQLGIVQLNPMLKEDQKKIFAYAKRRTPISSQFSIINPKLFMFHALYFLRENVYEVSDLNCLVCFHREGNTLRIFDIVGEQIPRFDILYPYISEETDYTIEFHFHTDKLGLAKTRRVIIEENNAFSKGNFPVNQPIFPYTSRA